MKTYKYLWRLICYRPWLYAADLVLWVMIHTFPVIPGLIVQKFLNDLPRVGHLNEGLWLLIMLLAASTVALAHGRYVFLWLVQIAFYGAALVGWLRTRSGRQTRVFALPFAFCLANVGFFLGMVKALRNQRIVTY